MVDGGLEEGAGEAGIAVELDGGGGLGEVEGGDCPGGVEWGRSRGLIGVEGW